MYLGNVYRVLNVLTSRCDGNKFMYRSPEDPCHARVAFGNSQESSIMWVDCSWTAFFCLHYFLSLCDMVAVDQNYDKGDRDSHLSCISLNLSIFIWYDSLDANFGCARYLHCSSYSVPRTLWAASSCYLHLNESTNRQSYIETNTWEMSPLGTGPAAFFLCRTHEIRVAI